MKIKLSSYQLKIIAIIAMTIADMIISTTMILRLNLFANVCFFIVFMVFSYT